MPRVVTRLPVVEPWTFRRPYLINLSEGPAWERRGGYFGVPKPAPPKLDVEGCPNVVTLPKETRLLSFGDGLASLDLASFANGLDRSGEYDCLNQY